MQNLKSSNPHSTQNFVVLYVYVLMHALPGIVDGARKNSQGGSWIWVGASLPMLEATASITSREQCMSRCPRSCTDTRNITGGQITSLGKIHTNHTHKTNHDNQRTTTTTTINHSKKIIIIIITQKNTQMLTAR